MLKVGLRTVDTHEVEEVDALLDSGATGLFIDCAWLHQKKITTCKLEHPIEVEETKTFIIMVKINGQEVIVLLDSGCTTEAKWYK